jgi:hypothetical protein
MAIGECGHVKKLTIGDQGRFGFSFAGSFKFEDGL